MVMGPLMDSTARNERLRRWIKDSQINHSSFMFAFICHCMSWFAGPAKPYKFTNHHHKYKIHWPRRHSARYSIWSVYKSLKFLLITHVGAYSRCSTFGECWVPNATKLKSALCQFIHFQFRFFFSFRHSFASYACVWSGAESRHRTRTCDTFCKLYFDCPRLLIDVNDTFSDDSKHFRIRTVGHCGVLQEQPTFRWYVCLDATWEFIIRSISLGLVRGALRGSRFWANKIICLFYLHFN